MSGVLSGEDNFVVWCLETCPPEITLEREQYWLDSYQPFSDSFGGFNIAKVAKAPLLGRKGKDHPSYGKPKSEIHRKRLSEAHKGKKCSQETIEKAKVTRKRNQKLAGYIPKSQRPKSPRKQRGPVSEETRKKLSESMMSSKNPNFGKPLSEESKKKISEKKKGIMPKAAIPPKYYHLISPDGEHFEGYGLKTFARQKEITEIGLRRVMNGLRAEYKGWKKG